MFKFFGNKRKYEDLTETIAAIGQFLIDDTDSDVPTPFKESLDSSKLDYSLESLRRVDSYLDKVRENREELSDEQFTKVILRCGAYCGEVIRKNSTKDFYWINYDTAIVADPRVKDFEKSAYTFYVLFSEPQSFSFPLAKVGKYLDNGPEDSLYFFAVMVGEFNQRRRRITV